MGAIALREMKHGDDVLPLCLFPHLAKGLVLHLGRELVQDLRCSSHVDTPRRPHPLTLRRHASTPCLRSD